MLGPTFLVCCFVYFVAMAVSLAHFLLATEIQVALQLAPSVSLASPAFGAKDIQESLFPSQIPSVSSFASFLKRQMISKVASFLDFEVAIETPSGGFIDTPQLGPSGLDIGPLSSSNTRLFPPSVDLDSIQVCCASC